MLNFIDAVHHFGARVADAQFIIVALLDHDKDVLINRRGKDAAAFLEMTDSRRAAGAQQVFRGWMFANAPGVSMLEHPVYDVRVLDCR